jgi:hypothetical protein
MMNVFRPYAKTRDRHDTIAATVEAQILGRQISLVVTTTTTTLGPPSRFTK